MLNETESDDAVDSNSDSQVEFLSGLVQSPSHTESPDDVEVASQLVDEKMRELGFGVERVVVPDGTRAAHRIYSSPATSEGDKCLALVGHVDTVYPRHWNLRMDGDGRMFGPGVMDMKGGLSVIVYGLMALKASHPDEFERLKVRIIMNTDEEKGSRTSRHIFSEHSEKISGALVFENGRDRDEVVVARKGTAPFEIVAEVPEGFPQHAGGKHAEGSSALEALMLAGLKVASMTDYSRGLTFNVVIRPGDKENSNMTRNVLPGRASFAVDCRYTSPGDANEAVELLRQSIANWDLPGLGDMHPKLIERVKRARIDVIYEGEGIGQGRPPMPQQPNMDLCERYSRHARECDLASGPAPVQGGVSDANFLAEHGVPVIDGLGPFGKNAHATTYEDEWIELENLVRKTKALARFLLEESQ
jgi:glutamate carboxypeptidase